MKSENEDLERKPVDAATVAFFVERQAPADREAFLRILNREGGESPRAGDER